MFIKKDVTLERLKVTVQKVLTGHVLMTTELESCRNEVINDLVFRLKAELMAEKLEDRKQTVTFEFPKSWWQHFKQEYFPKWLLNRFPVKLTSCEKTVIFKRYATYPELPVVFPETGRVVFKEYVIKKEQ